VRSAARKIKLLGDGTLERRLTIAVHGASGSAKAKVEKAGGCVELLGTAAPATAQTGEAPKTAR